MRPLPFISVIGVSVLFPLLLPAQTTPPKQEKLVFQNQFVRAFEVTLKGGEKLPPHDGGNRLVYSLNDYTVLYHWDGKTTKELRKAGDVHFHPKGSHAEENGGSTTAKFILVERLDAPLPQSAGQGPDMARVNPYNTKVVFDREMGKVFEVTLPPNDAVAMHRGLDRLVYSTTSADLQVTTEDGKATRETMKRAGYQWHSAGNHAVKNLGKETVKLVVFDFKK